MMKLKDAPFATLLVCEERIGDEVRRYYYVRRQGVSRLPNFVPTYGIATVQEELWRSW